MCVEQHINQVASSPCILPLSLIPHALYQSNPTYVPTFNKSFILKKKINPHFCFTKKKQDKNDKKNVHILQNILLCIILEQGRPG